MFINILMNVPQGCKWATRLAVNFTGTWRKCLCVHKVGSLLSLGLSLLLFKFVIHACVPLFHKQAGRQQCSCFKCSWTLPPTSSFSFSSLLTTAGWSRLYGAGRWKPVLPILQASQTDTHPGPKAVWLHRQHSADANFSALHLSLSHRFVCLTGQRYLTFSQLQVVPSGLCRLHLM